MAKGQNPRRGQISFLLPQKFLGIKSGTMHVLTRDFYFDSSGKTLLPKRDEAPVFLNSRVQEKQTRGKHCPTPPCHPMSFVLTVNHVCCWLNRILSKYFARMFLRKLLYKLFCCFCLRVPFLFLGSLHVGQSEWTQSGAKAFLSAPNHGRWETGSTQDRLVQASGPEPWVSSSYS